MSSVLRTGVATALSALLLPLAATGTAFADPAESPPEATTPAAGFAGTSATGRYVVRFSRAVEVPAKTRALRAEGASIGRRFTHALKGAVVTAGPDEAARIAELPGVVSVEPDIVVRISSWGLDRIDQRALPLTGDFNARGSGAGVDVYVVDTGVRADHVDLGGRVAPGYSIRQYADAGDCNGHGTHVAGTVAGTSSGVARQATVIPVRVLDCDGAANLSDVVSGLNWVAAQHTAGEPAVVNLSLGGDGTNTALDAAVEGVISDGVVAVVAAGNSAEDACNTSPSRVQAALTVSATSSSDAEASFANFGSCVDLYAPGVGISSAWSSSTNAFASLSGTSMAAPHVSGAAAVLLGLDPAATPPEVASYLVAASTTGVIGGLSPGSPDRLLFLDPAATSFPSDGAPVDSAPSFEADPAPTPDPEVEDPSTDPVTEVLAPTRAHDVRAVPGAGSAVVRWVRGTPRGARITGQTVLVLLDGRQVGRGRVGALVTGVRVTGLMPGRHYTFRVIEHSRVGSSRPSLPSNRIRILR